MSMSEQRQSLTAKSDHALDNAAMGARDLTVSPIIPRTAAEVGDYCKAMIAFEAIPAAYNSLPENKRLGQMVVAVMKGLELGMTPLRALQFIYVVNGIATLYGDAVPAFVMGSGLVEDWQESYEGSGDERVAIVRAKRRGIASYMERRFGVKDAAGQKLLGKPGPWQHSRDRMMMIRARTYMGRDLFADALHGLGVKEEQEDVLRSQGLNPDALTIDAPAKLVDPLADDDATDADFTETSAASSEGGADQADGAAGNTADGQTPEAEPPATADRAAGVAPGQPGDAGAPAQPPAITSDALTYNGYVWDPAAPERVGLAFDWTAATVAKVNAFATFFRTLLSAAPTLEIANAWIEQNSDTLLKIASKAPALAGAIREPLQRFEIAADRNPAATDGAPDAGGLNQAGAPSSSSKGAA